MKSKSGSRLQRVMIIYFLLIGFAAVLVGVEFLIETNGSRLRGALAANIERYSRHEIDAREAMAPIERLKNKAMLMIAIILFVVIVVLTMFIKKITEPLQHMIDTSREIAQGDLSQTITVQSDNELAELGNLINGMSSNLQEIILLSNNLGSSGNRFIRNTTPLFNQPALDPEGIRKVREEMTHLKSELDSFGDIITYFNFYTVEK